ncbi:YheC/YheD family protein [Brevibacillus composti]|uniref:YheC/YheD family protein n=1 Tax=Brevibacillus composti TaxID=2796470 RepID=A0A7T5EJ47_9BACL|nr:YheC/YheD family protein [Brevibacillus composti]QQE73555.1 YheC/YheD family protein [Brevibacillus composti]QUO40637.1 YheC/YheD family protein [Brevibacillus composti]
MPQLRSGWLTILPGGRWYLQVPRQHLLALRGRKKLRASLGPFQTIKRVSLGLPKQQPGRIRTRINWKVGNDTFKLGPLIGILTVGKGQHFLGNRENFKDIALTGKKLGALVYVFTPEGIDWSKKTVRGYLYDEQQGLWLEEMLPFPHVVYNRIPSRKAEKRTEVQETLSQFDSLQNVTLFNRCFFDKQKLFHTLGEYEEVTPYLPETAKLDSLSRFRQFCHQHRYVYLKPVLGKAGEGIMRVEQKKNGWVVHRLKEQKAITRRFVTLEGVWKHVKGHAGRKRYIMQQGIDRAKYMGKPFDVRVLVQKNGKGEWGVTGIGIRRAGSQSITTHVPRGGSIHSLGTVLQAIFKGEAEAIEASIKETALTIASALNQAIAGLAEMSMDLGLTKEGRLWLFEANAKPEKFDEPSIRRISLSNIIHYSQYVSRLQSGRGAASG